jgi:hypothetical protein
MRRLRKLGLWRLMGRLGLEVRVSGPTLTALQQWLHVCRDRLKKEGRGGLVVTGPTPGSKKAAAAAAAVAGGGSRGAGGGGKTKKTRKAGGAGGDDEDDDPDSDSDDGEPGPHRRGAVQAESS